MNGYGRAVWIDRPAAEPRTDQQTNLFNTIAKTSPECRRAGGNVKADRSPSACRSALARVAVPGGLAVEGDVGAPPAADAD